MAKIEIPELEQILKRLDNIEKILIQDKAGAKEVENTNPWMKGPAIRHKFGCGPLRIKEMVANGTIEMSMEFGRWPRYRVVK